MVLPLALAVAVLAIAAPALAGTTATPPPTSEPPAADGPAEAVEGLSGPTAPAPGLPGPLAPSKPVEPAPALAAGRHVLAFRPDVVVPLGDWAEVAGAGLGLNFAYDYRATDRLTWTGRVGYVVHLENERQLGTGAHTDLHTHEVPVLAGLRFEPLHGLYAAVEAGLVHFRLEQERGAGVETEGGLRLGGTVGAGYRVGDFDFGARLFLPDLALRDGGVDPSAGLSFQVGYTFANL